MKGVWTLEVILAINLKCAGLKLIALWDLKEHHIIIIIIKNHKGKISIEFQESVNLEKSSFKKTAKQEKSVKVGVRNEHQIWS